MIPTSPFNTLLVPTDFSDASRDAFEWARKSISESDAVIIAPSNPIVSIGPLLAVPGVRDAVQRRRDRVVAVSPIIGSEAIKRRADDLAPSGWACFQR